MVRDTEPWLIVGVALRVLEKGGHLGLPEPRVVVTCGGLARGTERGLSVRPMDVCDLVEQWLGAVSWRAQPVVSGDMVRP